LDIVRTANTDWGADPAQCLAVTRPTSPTLWMPPASTGDPSTTVRCDAIGTTHNDLVEGANAESSDTTSTSA
jgi:hypothetical protein